MLTASNLVFRGGNRTWWTTSPPASSRQRSISPPAATARANPLLVSCFARLRRRPHFREQQIRCSQYRAFQDRELARHRAVLSQAVEVAFTMPVDEMASPRAGIRTSTRPGPHDEKISRKR